MSDDLVPELHDIGKLVDKSLMNKDGHTFRRIDDRYKNRIKDNKNWVGIKFHTGEKTPNEYKGDMDLFYLNYRITWHLPCRECYLKKRRIKPKHKTKHKKVIKSGENRVFANYGGKMKLRQY